MDKGGRGAKERRSDGVGNLVVILATVHFPRVWLGARSLLRDSWGARRGERLMIRKAEWHYHGAWLRPKASPGGRYDLTVLHQTTSRLEGGQ
jgi:hypothetical protein